MGKSPVHRASTEGLPALGRDLWGKGWHGQLPADWEQCRSLTDQEKLVIRARYFDGLTLAATGALWGVGQERARQVESRALRRLRWFYTKGSGQPQPGTTDA